VTDIADQSSTVEPVLNICLSYRIVYIRVNVTICRFSGSATAGSSRYDDDVDDDDDADDVDRFVCIII